jgi:hypothetical protein
MYAQSTDRTANYKQNTLKLNEEVNNNYNITANKEGCYKQATGPGSELVYQSDMNDVTLDTCKQRASDLAYAGFSIKTKADGKLGCYLTNDVARNKTAGIATKHQTSLAFKTNKNANMGGLLLNGQLGIFQNKPDNTPLATDLPAIAGCNIDASKIFINPDSVTGTWGGNCPKPPRLKIKNSNAWQFIGTDRKTGGSPDASFWKVAPLQDGADTYYPVGHAVYPGSSRTVYSNSPSMSSVMVSGDVKDPVNYAPVGVSGGTYNISVKQPVCPQGYVSLGDIITSNNGDSTTPQNIKCIPADCVDTNLQSSRVVWSGLRTKLTGLNNNTNDPAGPTNGYNLFKSSASSPFYSIRDKCLT